MKTVYLENSVRPTGVDKESWSANLSNIPTISYGDLNRGLQLYLTNQETLKPATCRPCVLASGDSGTVPAITCDCSPVAELLMRRRYFDLCVTASSRTMFTFENNASCSSRDCSTIAFRRR